MTALAVRTTVSGKDSASPAGTTTSGVTPTWEVVSGMVRACEVDA